MRFDWLVVGAGLTGLTFAERRASEAGQRVLVIDERSHLGGNVFDERNEQGVLVHRYGPHIFHTNSEKVWHHLSRFTAWRPYSHRVLGLVDGIWVPIPFNLDSIERLFSESRAKRLCQQLVAAYGAGSRVPILDLRKHPDPDLQELAQFVFQKVFVGYTRKQWQMEPEQLDPAVTARVPLVVSRDDRYFQDRYQAMPEAGYSPLVSAMAQHPNITVQLNTPFSTAAEWRGVADRIFFTGRIDQFFGFRLGRLPYRSLRFESRTLKLDRFQQAGTHNYPGEEPFTRITEHKTLTGQRLDGTTAIVTEFPAAHVEGENDPYYPIPQPDNRALYARYDALAQAESPEVVFAGRLGDYQYYNMDQAVARGLTLAQRY